MFDDSWLEEHYETRQHGDFEYLDDDLDYDYGDYEDEECFHCQECDSCFPDENLITEYAGFLLCGDCLKRHNDPANKSHLFPIIPIVWADMTYTHAYYSGINWYLVRKEDNAMCKLVLPTGDAQWLK